jgi:5-hydroxyisourate hydrolase
MRRISTHILDLAQGKPAEGVDVRLERRDAGRDWVALGAGRTDHDGRCAQLLPESESIQPGIYRLVFDTASYHHSKNSAGFYPVVEITFLVQEGESQFHIPLLLSPFGFSTYRGS